MKLTVKDAGMMEHALRTEIEHIKRVMEDTKKNPDRYAGKAERNAIAVNLFNYETLLRKVETEGFND